MRIKKFGATEKIAHTYTHTHQYVRLATEHLPWQRNPQKSLSNFCCKNGDKKTVRTIGKPHICSYTQLTHTHTDIHIFQTNTYVSALYESL